MSYVLRFLMLRQLANFFVQLTTTAVIRLRGFVKRMNCKYYAHFCVRRSLIICRRAQFLSPSCLLQSYLLCSLLTYGCLSVPQYACHVF